MNHILPLSEGGTNDESNLESLCWSCYKKIHGKRGDIERQPPHLSKETAFVSMIDRNFLKRLKLVSFCVNYVHNIYSA
ncbi:HNH endonuclease [Erysipelotrichaceae bacterium Oil+RF-744-GAM-WT-6]|uniref:HNH endonuclease n=1 Tax=Stecheria intestinalis TaxID=2606630 RepID=A0A7X2NTJ5_9FIRM|nr:HNH endonuclease signature motif containing protein [Anaerolactibacter massiliensis]MSS59227.1 HNH endonuclease [Stecheria intestinalis]